MQPPFTPEEFFRVFHDYNVAAWPVQIVLILAALFALCCVIWNFEGKDRGASMSLAILWFWSGAVYQLYWLSELTAVAELFAVLWIAGAFLFYIFGVGDHQLRFMRVSGVRGIGGWSLVAYSLVGYPLLNLMLGHSIVDSPSFGLPCPTTLFTIGLLAFLDPPYPRLVFAAPVIWSLIGLQAALFLGVYADLALLPAAVFGIWLAVYNKRDK